MQMWWSFADQLDRETGLKIECMKAVDAGISKVLVREDFEDSDLNVGLMSLFIGSLIYHNTAYLCFFLVLHKSFIIMSSYLYLTVHNFHKGKTFILYNNFCNGMNKFCHILILTYVDLDLWDSAYINMKLVWIEIYLVFCHL